jgi:hypothetical protein
MEFLVELIQIIGEKIVENVAKKPKTRTSEEAFKKKFHLLRRFLTIAILVTSTLLPAYFYYDGYTSGNLGKDYYYIGVALVVTTFISNLFTLTKTLELVRQEGKAGAIFESSTIEDDIRHEIGLLVLFTFLSAIPILNLIVNPLSIDRAINILEITLNNPQRQKIRELAANIAFSALLAFLASSLVFSIILIILGDTRNL